MIVHLYCTLHKISLQYIFVLAFPRDSSFINHSLCFNLLQSSSGSHPLHSYPVAVLLWQTTTSDSYTLSYPLTVILWKLSSNSCPLVGIFWQLSSGISNGGHSLLQSLLTSKNAKVKDSRDREEVVSARHIHDEYEKNTRDRRKRI